MNPTFQEDSSCPLCRSPSFSDPNHCPTCLSVTSYRDREEVDKKNKKEEDDSPPIISFPGPGKVVHSEIYGNYVVASRRILKDELIIRERPLVVSCYGMSHLIPFCLSCYKDIGTSAKCRKCKWPVCNEQCENEPCHAENECSVFQSAGSVRYQGILEEYFSIEALRCLLLRRRKNDWKWRRVMSLETHVEKRKENAKAQETLRFITDFIRNKCKLGEEFDDEVVDKVVGILSVNSFWAFKDLKRYASILLDKVTLFAHDCDPNTNRRLVHVEGPLDTDSDLEDLDSHSNSGIAMEVRAARIIEPGEMITIRYVDIKAPVRQRRAELLDLFYFHCTCSRCLTEMMDQNMNIISSSSSDDNEGHVPQDILNGNNVSI